MQQVAQDLNISISYLWLRSSNIQRTFSLDWKYPKDLTVYTVVIKMSKEKDWFKMVDLHCVY